jgi:transcriptional regulator with XRE-family HTH domain
MLSGVPCPGAAEVVVVPLARAIFAARETHAERGLMPEPGSPTASRRELGSMLRALRARDRLTAQQVADRLEVSRWKVSRLETGKRGASEADIARLCDLFQVSQEQRSRLFQLAAEGKERVSWPRSLPDAAYFDLELKAESISDYGLAVVPGLLQVPDYARALVRAVGPALTAKEVEKRVQTRIARQDRLLSGSIPHFAAVLDESVLHRVVGSAAVMRAQLRRLLEMYQLPNVTIRIVPYEAGSVPAGVNKFIVMKFGRPDAADMVFIENLTARHYLEAPEDVRTYSAIFETLTGLSADLSASRAMILAKLTAFESRTG